MGSEIYEFQVEMTCEGCSNAVKRVLGKLEGQGVNTVSIDLEKKRVYVDSTLSSTQLLETIKKTGKSCSYIGVKSS
ncbi:copper transport protein ATOX1-like [Tachypleus tridentatus]|uniref:copper transport protein ATOX1-like n=1 Tax=Tachypleus tridentatus TaxID=6853 RepID=UPI003FD19007